MPSNSGIWRAFSSSPSQIIHMPSTFLSRPPRTEMNLKPAKKSRLSSATPTIEELCLIPPDEKRLKAPKGDLVDVTCSICQEAVGKLTPDGVTESWSILPCGHKFGSICIKHWLGLEAKDSPSCPICRKGATYICGHPVLPRVLPAEVARRLDGIRGPDLSELLQLTTCEYCRSTPTKHHHPPAVVREVGLWKGFAKFTWRMLRHGRLQRRPRVGSVEVDVEASQRLNLERTYMWIACAEVMREDWKRWWDNQEPMHV